MLTTLFFPDVAGLRVERVWRDDDALHLLVTTTRKWARCPACGRRPRRVQSRYQRIVADVPCGGTAVTLHVQARRFWFVAGFSERFAQDMLTTSQGQLSASGIVAGPPDGSVSTLSTHSHFDSEHV